jgi:hypothetical protein
MATQMHGSRHTAPADDLMQSSAFPHLALIPSREAQPVRLSTEQMDGGISEPAGEPAIEPAEPLSDIEKAASLARFAGVMRLRFRRRDGRISEGLSPVTTALARKMLPKGGPSAQWTLNLFAGQM